MHTSLPSAAAAPPSAAASSSEDFGFAERSIASEGSVLGAPSAESVPVGPAEATTAGLVSAGSDLMADDSEPFFGVDAAASTAGFLAGGSPTGVASRSAKYGHIEDGIKWRKSFEASLTKLPTPDLSSNLEPNIRPKKPSSMRPFKSGYCNCVSKLKPKNIHHRQNLSLTWTRA